MVKFIHLLSLRRYFDYFFVIGCFSAVFAGPLSAATILVDSPPASIQTAIDSASSGDTIQLSAGIYVEQIQVISKSLNIVGMGQNNTFIQAPDSSTPLTQFFNFGSNFWCVLMVDNQAAPTSQIVNISDLTVDGDTQQDTTILPDPSPGFYGSSNRFFAIGYHNANGTIQNVHTTNTQQSVNFDELAGGGIINASDTGIVTFDVDNCLVDFYQRQGIDCRGAALTATISNSTINRGYVLTPNTITATPNGIHFSRSATGSIINNLIEGNIATVPEVGGSGLISNGAGANLIISGNTINNNDNGIAAIQCGDNLTISSNTLNFTTTPGVNLDEGIIVQDTAGLSTINDNVMNNIPDISMEIISNTDQIFQLMNNQFIGSQTGLIVTGNTTAGPIITMNSDSFTGTVGSYIQEVASPNDIWPSTASVSFDGLLSGHITFAQFSQILTKILDQHNDPTLGLVLDFITPASPTLTAIDQSSGSATGGEIITINGSSFISSDTEVYFGTTLATDVTILSDTALTVTAPPGVGTVDVTVVTPFGMTSIVDEDQYTYVPLPPVAPLPPSHFVGEVKKERTNYIFKSKWNASSSKDVVLYRIYRDDNIVKEVSATSPLVFKAHLRLKSTAKKYQVVAVNSDGLESTPLLIKIKN